MKNRYQSKKEKSKRLVRPTSSQLHRRWKKRFFDAFLTVDEEGVPEYIPSRDERRYAPSRSETQAFNACQKFQGKLEIICEQLYRSTAGKYLGGFELPKDAKKFQRAFANDLGFWAGMRDEVTKGRERVIHTFMAEPILAGLEIYKNDDTGLERMRQFFEKDGEFSRRIMKWYGRDGEKLIRALCGKQEGKPLKKWVKAFRDLAFKNIVLPTDDRKKSNQERSRKGSPKDRREITLVENTARLRSEKIDERIKRLAQLIRHG